MRALADDGYLVVAPDHRDGTRFGSRSRRSSTGKPIPSFASPADWSDATFRDRADDIKSLLEAMKADTVWSKQVDWSRIALAGHSLGGYTVLGLAGAWPSWKLPGVKAVLALSPFCSPFVEKGSLGAMSVPVMYQGGTFDFGITPFIVKGKGAFDLTSAPACYVELNGAGHFAWTDLNPAYRESICFYCTAFLDRYVKGDRSADPLLRRKDVSAIRSK